MSLLPSRISLSLGAIVSILVLSIAVFAAPASRPVSAADSTALITGHAPATGASATLRIGNRDVAEFRTRLLGYSPAERAATARDRITKVINSHRRGDMEARVDLKASDAGWMFLVDGKLAFLQTAADVDTVGGEDVAALMGETRVRLAEAVNATLEQRSPARLVRSIVLSVLATILVWILLVALSRSGRWLHGRVAGVMQRRTERMHLPTSEHADQISNLMRGVIRTLVVLLGLVFIDIWLTFVLKQFPYTYPWGDQIDDYLITAVSSIGLAVLHSIPDLLMLTLIFVIARFATRWIGMLFDAVKDGRFAIPGVDEETAGPAKRLTVAFLWILTFAFAYPFIPGSQGVAFKGVSVLLGLMLSLGSSNVLSQAASGYMLMFSKALRVNDYIRIGEHEGTVQSIGVLSTKIRTPRDEEINVPNSVIVGTTTTNYTRLNRETGAPVTTKITIGYSAPWRQVHAMLKEAAAGTEGLRKVPEPVVLQSDLSDFYVEYTLFARLERANERARVLSRLHANIQDLFNQYGVQIMSPHYEGDPDGKVWVPKEKWHEAPAEPDVTGESGRMP